MLSLEKMGLSYNGGPSKGPYQQTPDSLEESSSSSMEAKGAQNLVGIVLK